MKTKLFSTVSLLCIIFLVLWVVFMVLSTSKIGPIDTLEQAVNSVANPGLEFYLTYINAVIFTILVTALFACLYLYCKPEEPEWALIGLIFVPVYSTFNLFSYFSQISIIPKLISHQSIESYKFISNILVGQMVQGWSGSSVAVINSFAYALLGIPSIIFGVVLLRKGYFAKASGVLLILNAVACIIGVIGITTGNKIIGSGSLIGGVIFLFAVIFIWLMLKKEGKCDI